MATRPVSFRLEEAIIDHLDRLSRVGGLSRNALVERLIREGARVVEHPGIAFRDGSLGRRAILSGTRIDVWQVIEILRENGNDVPATAGWLDLPEARIRTAVGYYAANRDEVDAIAVREREASERARQQWLAEQSVLGE